MRARSSAQKPRSSLSGATKGSNELAARSPTELPMPLTLERGVERHRNLECGLYDKCLDEAVQGGWNGWTCARCRQFATRPGVRRRLEKYATERRA